MEYKRRREVRVSVAQCEGELELLLARRQRWQQQQLSGGVRVEPL